MRKYKMDVQDRLRLAHESVCVAENKNMRRIFNLRQYHNSDEWEQSRQRKITGAIGGKKNLSRTWVKERKV